MLKGIDNSESIEFISTTDTAENPTVFLLGNIKNRDKLKLFADAIDASGVIDMAKMSDRVIDIAKAGLKGIRNLSGKDYIVIDDAVMEMITLNVTTELATKIIKINFPEPEQIKN
jgi:hypothetical protein